MNIGMLWFDNDTKRNIDEKITRAAQYYRQKYGITPSLCFVHPSMVNGDRAGGDENPIKSGDITVRTLGSILPNHFWIGVNGTN